jgi:hypothetical protein
MCTNDIYFEKCELEVDVNIIFYLKPDGEDKITCNKYVFPCKTIDYVLIEIVNKTEYSIVYIDSGMYNCGVIADGNKPDNGFFNRPINLVGFFLGPSVNADDIDTYPTIISNVSSSYALFYFYANVSTSFECLKFIIGNNSGENRGLIMSFFIYLFIFIIFV